MLTQRMLDEMELAAKFKADELMASIQALHLGKRQNMPTMPPTGGSDLSGGSTQPPPMGSSMPFQGDTLGGPNAQKA